jgi:hypothetical protein
MAATTLYFVQAYGARGRKLTMGALRQVDRAEKAMRLGRRLSRKAEGAIAYRIRGEPELDWWEDPVVLARFGRTPGEGAEAA